MFFINVFVFYSLSLFSIIYIFFFYQKLIKLLLKIKKIDNQQLFAIIQ